MDDFDKFCLLIAEKQQTLHTKITIVKCDFYEDNTSTFSEISLFQPDIKDVSLFEQPIAELSSKQLLLENQEFKVAIVQSSSGNLKKKNYSYCMLNSKFLL